MPELRREVMSEEIKASAATVERVDAWIGTGDAFDDFEVIAEWFRRDTGLLAPGKDSRQDDVEERRRVKGIWNDKARAQVLKLWHMELDF